MEEIVKESLEMYVQYMEALPSNCLKIANLIKEDSILIAIDLIRQYTEGMDWLIQMNQLLVSHGVIEELNIEELQGFLVEMTDALQIQDYVLIADLFEYEIAPFFEAYIAEINMN